MLYEFSDYFATNAVTVREGKCIILFFHIAEQYYQYIILLNR